MSFLKLLPHKTYGTIHKDPNNANKSPVILLVYCESPNIIIVPPIKPINIPIIIFKRMGCDQIIQENKRTINGFVVTKRTELATEVKLKDQTQKQKCIASPKLLIIILKT